MAWSDKSLLSSECIRSILKSRMQFLSDAMESGSPIFSWKMDGTQVDDYDLKRFLESDERRFAKRGFTGIKFARAWAVRDYFGRSCIAKYSVTRMCCGSGKKSYVLVEK